MVVLRVLGDELMADEESEIRRMAEIADAINAIFDADPVGDTPAQACKAHKLNAMMPLRPQT